MTWLLFLSACRRDDLAIVTTPALAPLLEDVVATIGDERLGVEEAADPRGEIGRGFRLAVEEGLDAQAEAFQVSPTGKRGALVEAADALGAQMGLAQALEDLGYRFYHPHASHLPDLDAGAWEAHELVGPEVARRGLHLHTLHPTDALLDFWAGGPDALDNATAVMDWVVRNRGNHLQWVALDDVEDDDDRLAEWRTHTAEVIARAHARGLTVGIGLQLFGSGSLQQSYTLLDSVYDAATLEDDVRARLHRVLDETPFDLVSLSFGEFFGEDPQTFVDTVSTVSRVMAEDFPETELTTVIHVGNFEELRVEWQGKEVLYYFLAAHADPPAEPWVHTVMYYDLFEDAGGAYLHDEFTEHREFLLGRVAEGQPVTYFPESAYWVAFDNDVPTYLPLYVRSRWTDLVGIREAGRLPAHVVFTTGWEWGYWQTDLAALRMSHTLPGSTSDVWGWMFEPLPHGEEVAATVAELQDVQHDALMERRLAAYFAGRDAIMDVGDTLGIVSQPDRPTFEELAGMTSAERAAFRSGVVADLEAFAAALEGLALPASEDPFEREVNDGLEIDQLRARFAVAIWTAAIDHADGADTTSGRAEAAALLEDARAVVARRHGELHDPDAARLVEDGENATIYHYGYLRYADDLCFWERERVQLDNLVTGAAATVPACIQ